jgi:hypothetical protein
MQRLSTVCCFLLVIMSSVLLRSQTLLSSGRPINFDPKTPSQTAHDLPFDVRLTIVILVGCIMTPFIVLVKPLRMLQACVVVLKLCWLSLKQLIYKRARAGEKINATKPRDAGAPLVVSASEPNEGEDLEMSERNEGEDLKKLHRT